MFNLIKPKISVSTKSYVTNMEEYMRLSGSTLRTLEKLWVYEFPKEITRRLKKKFPFNSMSDREIGICIEEFKKFIAIMVIGKKEKKGVAMTSNVIDEVWHEFVLFTLDYHAFGELIDIPYIHHTPNTKTFSFGPRASNFFFETYKKYFGEMHPIWQFTIQEEVLDGINSGNSHAMTALMFKTKIDGRIDAIHHTTRQILVKKKGSSPLPLASTGSTEEKSSSLGGYGGIFYCGAYTSGYAGSDATSLSESGFGEGGGFWASLGGDGGDSGGCSGCGGCGG